MKNTFSFVMIQNTVIFGKALGFLCFFIVSLSSFAHPISEKRQLDAVTPQNCVVYKKGFLITENKTAVEIIKVNSCDNMQVLKTITAMSAETPYRTTSRRNEKTGLPILSVSLMLSAAKSLSVMFKEAIKDLNIACTSSDVEHEPECLSAVHDPKWNGFLSGKLFLEAENAEKFRSLFIKDISPSIIPESDIISDDSSQDSSLLTNLLVSTSTN